MMMVMMKPDKEQNLIEEGSETQGSTVKECNEGISSPHQYSHQHSYANKPCDVSSLTIQALKTSHNRDASPEKRILCPNSIEEVSNPNKLCRYSYMDCTSRSRSSTLKSDNKPAEERNLEELVPKDNTTSASSDIAFKSDFGDLRLKLNEAPCIVVHEADQVPSKDDEPICNSNFSPNTSHVQQKNSDTKESPVVWEASSNLTAEGSNKPAINHLPRCLLVHIFSYLPMQDILANAAYVCKLWYDVSKDPDLWRDIKLEDTHGNYRITDNVLDRVTSISNNISSILLADCYLITDSGLASIFCKCANLRALYILRCSRFTDRSYTSIADQCHRLKILNLSGSTGITDVGLQKIACSCQQLEHVQLNRCSKITDKSTQVLAIKCTNIKLIMFQNNEGVTDASVEALASHCKSLQSLTIHKCSLSTDGFFHLAKIPTLTKIDISNNKNVTPAAVKYVVNHCRHLQLLNLCLCHSIDDDCIRHIAIYAKEIKKLLLVGCRLTDEALLSLGKYAGNLEHIDVGWCEEITDHGVIAISKMCLNLNYLGLMRCDKVSDQTMLQLAQENTHILYSTFLLDSQRLIAQASQKGFVFKFVEEYNSF
ncbi:F-box/LRR-repeat protein 17-like [Anneissia japonica]|uniref:F-box/LRR-repeat protein 17-like n=1 Tax=Anneissia japonica TaxID=1529436 RepID=UPI0014258294|nr:F-box/LRR-repeat protein 17-like [Anneissia japonica]XP_033105754.1 F-box/LRR-repeat protein 17-like [Anneissia japonica]XP_033105755.1 F-box/LRR-repeat protein 17-like [Anneissia japonica]XP_033105756.1 F-box/LRR-repeat protein 17-like [Anneissia japonica]